MNRREKDVLLALSAHSYIGQRDLAELCGCSLGAVNAAVKNLLNENCINPTMQLTDKSRKLLAAAAPKRAILLAAGLGMRIPPTGVAMPKALLEVRGEVLIERLIRQLHEVGIFEIHVVVGFLKEQFEYLIDRYGVELHVSSDFTKKNNLHSLALVNEYLENCYVVPCDLWCKENPFRKRELYSWYMVTDAMDRESSVRVNRKQELAVVSPLASGNDMIGISYLLDEDAEFVCSKLKKMVPDRRYDGSFWEETLYEGEKLRIGPRLVPSADVIEVNSLEDLQRLEGRMSFPLLEVSKALNVEPNELTDVLMLKRGITNCSYSFICRDSHYVARVPCDEAETMVDYKKEAEVHNAIAGSSLIDEVIYFNPKNGLKISKFIDATRSADPFDPADVNRCMQILRQFHQARFMIDHEFDLFDAIEELEHLRGEKSVYSDYEATKKNVFSLRSFVEGLKKDRCLIHFDAVVENFLFSDSGQDRLIDWEYATMYDPHLDIAMFGLYSLYSKQQMDQLITAYFPEGCTFETKLKIYCYVAAGGLFWSNWCEYKFKSGIEFGEYSLRQYRYAKEYYRLVKEELSEEKER